MKFEFSIQQIPWAAALFEGEGSVFRHKGKNGGRMNVRQKYRDVLDVFCAIVGAGKVLGPHKSSTHCDMFTWQCSKFPEIERIFKQFQPFLSTRRAAQFQQLLANPAGPVGTNQHPRKR